MKMRRFVALSFFFVFVFAINLPAKDRPNYDALANSSASKDLSPDAKEKAEKLVKHGAPMHVESHLGVPNFLFANSTSAQGENLDKGQKAGRGGEESAARRHMARFAPLYHLDDIDVATAEQKGVHNTGRGAVVVQFRQRVDGVEVFDRGYGIRVQRSTRGLKDIRSCS